MSLSNATLAFTDCKEFLERALDADRGARVPFQTEEQAGYWRMRCYQFSKLDRKDNELVYNPGDRMFGQSEYDCLSLVIKRSTDGFFWVYAEKRTLDPGMIEDIPDEGIPLQIDANPQQLIEDHSDDTD